MKNKYDDMYYKIEKRNENKFERKLKLLVVKFNLYAFKFKITLSDIDGILINLHLFPTRLKIWVKENIFSQLGKDLVLETYMKSLTYSISTSDDNLMKYSILSLKNTGLVKDVTYDEDKKIFILITKNNKEIKFTNLFDDVKLIDRANGYCHYYSYIMLKDDPMFKDASGITLFQKYIYDYPIYHSLILKSKSIVDPARNLIMDFDDYKELFEREIIMCVDRKTMLEEIDRLQENDEEFNKSSLNNMLKLAINKQMKHN